MSALERLRIPSRRAQAVEPVAADTTELHRRNAELTEQVAQMTSDLGGLTYEMAIRDHFRLDVLVRRAAELQETDGQLGEVQRLLAAADQGIAGQCRSCGAVHSRGATYCWQCGQPLMLSAEAAPASPGTTELGSEP